MWDQRFASGLGLFTVLYVGSAVGLRWQDGTLSWTPATRACIGAALVVCQVWPLILRRAVLRVQRAVEPELPFWLSVALGLLSYALAVAPTIALYLWMRRG